jgi:hypothetical protein
MLPVVGVISRRHQSLRCRAASRARWSVVAFTRALFFARSPAHRPCSAMELVSLEGANHRVAQSLHRARCRAAILAFPSAVFGPVLLPPWFGQRPFARAFRMHAPSPGARAAYDLVSAVSRHSPYPSKSPATQNALPDPRPAMTVCAMDRTHRVTDCAAPLDVVTAAGRARACSIRAGVGH